MTDRPWPTRPVYPKQLPAIDTTVYICPCTHVDGKVYPDPNQTCPNGHTRGAVTEQEWLGNIPAGKVVDLAEGIDPHHP